MGAACAQRGGFGFCGADGMPVVRGRLRHSVFRTSGQIEIVGAEIDRDLLVVAVLTALMLIRNRQKKTHALGAALISSP